MPRLAACALLLALALTSSAGAASPRCGAGRTVFKDGALRIFSIAFSQGPYASGTEHYACLRGQTRGIEVGGDYSDASVASSATPAYVWDGARYLVAYETSDGEGGPDAHHAVLDLRRRRFLAVVNAPYDDPVPPFHVTGAGELLRAYGEVELFGPGADRFEGRPLSTEGAGATGLAFTGTTAYWMEGGAARSATVPGPSTGGENHLLAPVRAPRGSSACTRRRGRTLARSARVRVLVRAGGRIGCRGDRRFRLPAEGAVRILADRWVVTDGADVTVHDARTGARTATAPAAQEWTLLRGGTLAWTEADGTLLAGGEPLAEGASALASAGRRLYWTAAGMPSTHAARPRTRSSLTR